MNAVHIFHHNDLDGRIAAAIIYRYFKECRVDITKYLFYEIDYTITLDKEIYPQDTVVFVDYSFSKKENIEYLMKLIIEKHEIIWIDHHNTSYNLINGVDYYGVNKLAFENCRKASNFTYVIDCDHCGTWLTYTWVQNRVNHLPISDSAIPKLIKYVESYDLWKFDMPKTEEFHYGMMGLDYTPKNFFNLAINGRISFLSLSLDSYTGVFINDMIQNGIKVKSYITKRNEVEQEFAGFPFMIEINGNTYTCYAMNIHGNSSVFGRKCDQYDITVPFIFKEGKQWKYSLFTRDEDIDCSEIAKALGTIDKLGGGGHKGAAGFQTKKCILTNGCKVVIKKSIFGKTKIKIERK